MLQEPSGPSNRYDALRRRIIVAETVCVEHVAYPEVERRQDYIQQVRCNVPVAVPRLPKPPQAIDHRMVGPEYGIVRGRINDPHVAGHPAVDPIVQVLESSLEIGPVG